MDKWLLIGAFLLTFASILKFLTVKTWTATEKFLIIALLSLLVNTIILYLNYSENYQVLAQLYRIGTLSVFVFLPACFLFIKYSLVRDRLRWPDLILFIPAIVFTIDYLPFFLSDVSFKMKAMMKDFEDGTGHLHLQSHIMPAGFYFFLQGLIGIGFSTYLIIMIPNYIRLGGKNFLDDNKSLILWNCLLAFFLLLTSVPDFLFSLTGQKFDITAFTYITPCLFLYLSLPLGVLLISANRYGVQGYWVYSIKQGLQFSSKTENEIEDIIRHSIHLISKEFVTPNSDIQVKGLTLEKKYITRLQARLIEENLINTIRDNKLYEKEMVGLNELSKLSKLDPHQINGFLRYSGFNDLTRFIHSHKPD